MTATHSPPKGHLFICCRQRKGKASCGAKNSLDMVDKIKTQIKKEGLKNQLKVSQSSCLGFCERGITACLYPQNQWFFDLNEESWPSLLELLKKSAK